jgi:phosphoglycerate kinase
MASKTDYLYDEASKRKRNVFDVLQSLKVQSKQDEGAKSVLVRVDFNVPMNADGTISDDSRIRGALPTIEKIIQAKCNAIIISHMGRPKLVQKGLDDSVTKLQRESLSLKPVAEHLQKLLGMNVAFASDCVGAVAYEAVDALPKEGGGLLVLENLRFHKEEEKNETKFTESLASLADAYVNDAFGTCHRAHASVTGVPTLKPKELCGVGLLVEAEVSYLDFENIEPGASITAIIGGSKVSTKLPVIEGLLNKVDTLVLGGGLAFTFLKALSIRVGNSLVEDSMIDVAKELLDSAERMGKRIILPVDAVCAREFPKSEMKLEDTLTFDLCPESGIDDGWSGFDIGPKSVELFRESIVGTTKLIFNGPMGVFEMSPFEMGTKGVVDILRDITKEGTITVVGGGDSVAALEMFDETTSVSYVSTGGGATLELLSGAVLPGVDIISDNIM